MRLEKRKVLVVGVGRGLGSAVTYQLLKEGAKVAITARSAQKLKEVSDGLQKYGKIISVTGDAASLSSSKKLLEEAARKLGGIDDLVITTGGFTETPIEQLDEAKLQEMMDVNLKAPLFLIRSAMPFLHQGSSITAVSAINGAFQSTPKLVAYSASKAALARSIGVIASELLSRGIRANAVAPLSMLPDFKPERDYRKMRKLGDHDAPPEDVASVLVWLLTEEASWVNGVVIPVDGGARLKRN